MKHKQMQAILYSYLFLFTPLGPGAYIFQIGSVQVFCNRSTPPWCGAIACGAFFLSGIANSPNPLTINEIIHKY